MIDLPKLIIILVALVILIIYFVFGPNIPQSDHLDFSYQRLLYKNDRVTIANVEDYLESIEGADRYIEFVKRKRVIFYDTARESEYVLLYFHGFHSSNREAYVLVKELSAKLNANCFLARFPGHGVLNTETSHIHVNLYHYLRDVYESFLIASLLGKKIIVMGSSTGCTYAIWACTRFAGLFNIHSCIFFSPNIELYGIARFLTKILVWPWGEFFCSIFRNKMLVNGYIIDHNIALQLLGILAIVRKLQKKEFQPPLLVFSCKRDKIVSHNAAVDFFNKIGTKHKQLEIIDSSDHQIINNSKLKQFFVETILSFLKNTTI